MITEEILLKPTPTNQGPFLMDIYEPAGYVLPRYYRSYYKQVLNLPIYDDDVWIVSHPKCGTTWTSEMVWLLRNNHDFNAAKQILEERVPFFEYTSLLLNRLDDEQAEKQKKTLPMLYGDSFRYVAESKGPRTIKSHLQWNVLPRALRQPDSKAKIIYLTREAKDVCVSFYHHHKAIQKYSGTFEQYAESFLSNSLMYAPFWKHVLEFWKLKDRQNILFLKYENMKKDLPAVIRQVNEFLKLPPLCDEQLDKLNHHLCFTSMKSNKAVNTTSILGSLQEIGKLKRCEGDFIRKGIVGDWKEEMSPEMVRRFNEWTAQRLSGSGLTFENE